MSYPTNNHPIRLLPAFFLFLISLPWLASAYAASEGSLRTTDYYLSHESTDPFYKQHDMSPNVLLHVREVVMSGRERTVHEDSKVLVLVHGGTFPGTVAFDTDAGDASLMRYLARLGWDTFALDLEGFGSPHVL